LRQREKEFAMSRLNEFFKRSQSDRKLMSDLDAFFFKMQQKKDKKLDAYVSELTETARRHGIFLSPEDFFFRSGELEDLELAEVTGGGGTNALAQLWLDLYDMQSGNDKGTDEAAKPEDK
jgi:hypothetical protein